LWCIRFSLPETHVAGQNAAAAGQKKGHPFDLVGEQTFGEAQRLLEGHVVDFLQGWNGV
jgi:hypothetical protein